MKKLKMAMASRGPVFAHHFVSPKWSRRTTRADQSARAPIGVRALGVPNLHTTPTTGGAAW